MSLFNTSNNTIRNLNRKRFIQDLVLHHITDTHAILRHLEEAACEKIDAIVILREIPRISLGEAKDMVELSPFWEYRKASDSQFHDKLMEMLKQGPNEPHP